MILLIGGISQGRIVYQIFVVFAITGHRYIVEEIPDFLGIT